jgi:UDP-3-O-[3-hydroxymyristoyl] glucosamine N-acyltransferase
VIHPSAVIGPDVTLGANVEIGAHVSIEGTVNVGDRTRIDAGARIGVEGFGYTLTDSGVWAAKSHVFGVEIEADVVVGANTVVCRGSYRNTLIARGTKLDSQVFVAHNVQIDEDCLIIAHAELSGSVAVGPGVIIGPRVCVKEHVAIGEGALIGIGAVVLHDVPPGQVWAGSPARYLRDRRDGEAV